MAHLLIIDLPGGNDCDLIHAALSGGHSFSFLSADLPHYLAQPQVAASLQQARACLHVPGFEQADVAQQVLALHAQHRIDAVLCLVDIRLVEAARLAELLGNVHIGVATATLLRDKFSVRRRLAEHGIAQPAFALATSAAELHAAVQRLGLPVLIKPCDGYGSQNIVALQYDEDLDPLLSPLDDMLPCRADYGLGVRANDRLLVERLMQGQFIGCDSFSLNGQHRLLGVNLKQMFAPPSFAIRGGTFVPRELTGQLPGGLCWDELQRYVFAVLDAVGFDAGATHMELMVTSDGLQLVEVNPRLVGARIGRLISLATQRSVHADLIALHLGRWPDGAPLAGEAQAAATRWLVADDDGVLENIELPPAGPGIAQVDLLSQPGERVRRPQDNADRLGCVMSCADSVAEAESLAEAFVAGTRVVLQRQPLLASLAN